MGYNPSVNITVNEALSLSPGESVTTIMIVGTAQWGPIDSVQSFTNFSNVLNTFGEDRNDNTSITKMADIVYSNGAQSVKVLRIADSGKIKATLDLAGDSAGTADVMTFNAKYYGAYGNNFYVDIDEQGTGRIATITNGDYKEVFDNNGDANGYASNALLAAAINDSVSGSALIDAVSNSVDVIDATASLTQLTTGDDGANGLSASDYTTAFDSYLSTEDWDILVIGDTDNTNLESGDAFQSSITTKVDSRASTNKKYSMYFSGVTQNEIIGTIQARTASGSRLVLAAPGIEVDSRVESTTAQLDGTYLAGALAGMVAANDIEIALTRKVVGVNDFIINTSTDVNYYNLTEVESLLGSGVCVSSKLGGALKVARGVTRISDKTSVYYEINIRRIVDDIRTKIQNLLDGFLGDPSVERNRKMIASECDGVLNSAVAAEELVAYQTTQVTEASSPDTINVALTIQPTFAINFIDVVISVSKV